MSTGPHPHVRLAAAASFTTPPPQRPSLFNSDRDAPNRTKPNAARGPQCVDCRSRPTPKVAAKRTVRFRRLPTAGFGSQQPLRAVPDTRPASRWPVGGFTSSSDRNPWPAPPSAESLSSGVRANRLATRFRILRMEAHFPPRAAAILSTPPCPCSALGGHIRQTPGLVFTEGGPLVPSLRKTN